MAFTTAVKDEILRQPDLQKCCLDAFLSAIFRINGVMVDPSTFRLHSENALLVRKIYSILKHAMGFEAHMTSAKSSRLKKHSEYAITINITPPVLAFLKKAGIEKDSYKHFYGQTRGKQCCRRSYLAGAFLAAGSLNEPEKAYHFEIPTHSWFLSEELSEIMNSFGLNAHVIGRKSSYVVYIKEAESISDVLRVIRANRSLAEYENIRIVKDMRNNINRTVNCETANISKTVESSMKQVEDIELIFSHLGRNSLPEGLLQVADARLENLDASLKEIGDALEPKITRSGVNHRFKNIQRIADEIREKKK